MVRPGIYWVELLEGYYLIIILFIYYLSVMSSTCECIIVSLWSANLDMPVLRLRIIASGEQKLLMGKGRKEGKGRGERVLSLMCTHVR